MDDETKKGGDAANAISMLEGAKSQGSYVRMMSQEDRVAEAERQAGEQANSVYEAEKTKIS